MYVCAIKNEEKLLEVLSVLPWVTTDDVSQELPIRSLLQFVRNISDNKTKALALAGLARFASPSERETIAIEAVKSMLKGGSPIEDVAMSLPYLSESVIRTVASEYFQEINENELVKAIMVLAPYLTFHRVTFHRNIS